MGSGKSTIGRELASQLGWPFRDLDEVIEAEQGQTIPQIFDTQGETAFRAIETAALERQLGLSGNLVLALGGGAFVQPRNRALLTEVETVWLDCPFSRVQARVQQDPNRPNARDPERFARLFADRRPAYAEARHRVAIESDDPVKAVQAILALVPAQWR
jgi:shikimate kinase